MRDEEARKRFHREAQAAAALSHPNVTTIYEIDEADGQTFLALEYVEGETLEQRIEKGPLQLKEALDSARQIADGLQEAHAGVVHRDVKPGNIIVTPDGRVKILDFGLALLTEGSKLTQLDTTVGTVAYMSPEQAQGAKVDHRTDIWSLGCVIYEMLRGERPFPGVHDQALLYEICNQDPEPLTAVRAGVPMEFELLVAKCLAKEAEDRYQSASELVVDLRTLAEKMKSGRSTIVKTAAAGQPKAEGTRQVAPLAADEAGLDDRVPTRKLRLMSLLAAGFAIAFAALSFLYFTQAPPETPTLPVRRFSFTPESLYPLYSPPRAVISPNGRHIVYVSGDEPTALWMREIDREQPRKQEGPDGALYAPFWSPDSRFIGFVVGDQLKKIAVEGGPAVTICTLPGGPYDGGDWSHDGETIVFSAGGPLRCCMRCLPVEAVPSCCSSACRVRRVQEISIHTSCRPKRLREPCC